MTKQTKTIAIVGIGALALWWFYRSRQGLSVIPAMGSPLNSIAPSGGVGVPSREPLGSIDSPEIVAARGAATGPSSRKACALPSRWIKTITPPYYGFCVTQAQFDEWNRSLGGVVTYMPTDAKVRSILTNL